MIARTAKPRPSRLDARDAAFAKERNWRDVCRVVKVRDRGKCRLCANKGYEVHHVEFRSRGGKDVPENLILVCRAEHADIHGHVIKLAGTASDLRVGRWSDSAQDYVWRKA